MKKLIFFLVISFLIGCKNEQSKIRENIESYLKEFKIKSKIDSLEYDSSSLVLNLRIEKPYKIADYGERDLFLSYLIFLLNKEYEINKVKIISYLEEESNFNKRVLEYSSEKLDNLNSVFDSSFLPLIKYCMFNFQLMDVYEFDSMINQVNEILSGSVLNLPFYELLKNFSKEKDYNGKASFTFFIIYRFLEDSAENSSGVEKDEKLRMKVMINELWKLNKNKEILKKDIKEFNKMFSEAISKEKK